MEPIGMHIERSPQRQTLLMREAFEKSDVFAIIEILKRASTVDVAHEGCLCIAASNANWEKYGRFACAAVVKTLITFGWENAQVAQAAFRAISVLALNDDNRTIIGQIRGCPVVVTGLIKHGSEHEPALAREGLNAIWNLASGNAANKKALGQAGACSVAVNAYKAFGGELAEEAFGAIRALAYDINNRVELRRAGACEVVVEGLIRHGTKNPKVAYYTCAAICELALDNDNKDALRLAGACDAVVGVLLKGAENSNIARDACGAIWNFASNVNANLPQLAGACQAVVNTLEHFVSNADVVYFACGALRNLSNVPINRKILHGKGAFEQIIKVLTEFGAKDVRIAQECCEVIGNLASDDQVSHGFLVAKPYEAVIKVLKTFGAEHAQIAETCCGIVANLALDDASRQELHQAGAVEEIHNVIMLFGLKNAQVAAQGCIAVWNLAKGNHDKDELDQVKTRDVFFDVMNAQIAVTGCKVISKLLADGNSKYAKELGARGACDMIVKVLKTYGIDDPEVACLGCKAVCSLAREGAYKKHLSCVGAYVAIINVLTKFGEQADAIAEEGCAALYHLIGNHAKQELPRIGLCETIVKVLAKFGATNAQMAVYACMIVAILAGSDAGIVEELTQNGACNAVVNALATFGADIIQIAVSGCTALRFLANHEIGAEELARVGAAEVVIEVLNSFGMVDVRVAEQGCRILCSMADINDEVRKELGQKGACEVALKIIINLEIKDVTPAKHAYMLAWLLALNADNLERFNKSEARSIIVEAFAEGGELDELDESLAFPRALAMSRLTANGINMKEFHGACKTLVKLLAKFGYENKHFAEIMCEAIGNLAWDPDNRRELGLAGACDAVVKVLEKFVKNVENLAPDDDIRKELELAEAGDAAVKLFEKLHKVNGKFACRVLQNLAGDAINKEELKRLGAIQVVEACVENEYKASCIAALMAGDTSEQDSQ